MTNHQAVLVKIANMKPSHLRELIYVTDEGFTRRNQVKRLYRTRGDLVAAVFNLYHEGKLNHLHETS